MVSPMFATRENLANGVEVPNPTLPACVTTKSVLVEEPITNCGALLSKPLLLIERRPQGLEVPIPTLPALVIAKWVEVAMPRVEEAMMNANGLLIEVEAKKSESVAIGDVVPTPTLPEKVVVEKREVLDAKIPMRAQSAVEVAEVEVPKLETLGSNGYAPVPTAA